MIRKLYKSIAILLILALLLPSAGGLSYSPRVDVPAMQDVSPDDWFYPYVVRSFDFGLVTGTSAGEFRFEPHRNVTRAEFITMLGRLHEHWEDNTIDIPADGTFYGRYLAWAVEHGIMHGNQHGDLMPYALITREQMAVIVYRYIDVFALQGYWENASPDGSVPADYEDISDWARHEVLQVLYRYGLMRGTSPNGSVVFRPQANSSRAEALTVLVRLGNVIYEPELLTVCPGCGDVRSFRVPSLDEPFEDNSVIFVLTRCASRADNRVWTVEDFGDIEGLLYVRDLMRLNDTLFAYARRLWDAEEYLALAEKDYLLSPNEDTEQALYKARQAYEEARTQAEGASLFNYDEFRRIMLIRLDQNCKENVVTVIQQLQQFEFISSAGPNSLNAPG
ncbi:MAG: S-layer homology domain-containing protein [Oscillospiraceae bacterium]|nr:S-layer homology domain-containing protein [Oscillospiraceae bacterium]